jgi:hypothetical protein
MDIPGAEHLTAIFGTWPSFHDAEVVRLVLDRADSDGREYAGPTLTLAIRVFTFGPEVAASGAYVLHHETLATLRFGGVTPLAFGGFNQQNVLAGLHIADVRERQLEGLVYEVVLEPSYGFGGHFLCATAEVLSAEPWPVAGRTPVTGADV